MLYEFALDSNLAPPIADERLRILSDGVGGGLVGDFQWNAVVLTNTVAVSIQHAVVVENLIGAFDVLCQASVTPLSSRI